MKKSVYLLIVILFVFTSCATRRMLIQEYGKEYDYDRLYQSALMTLNSNNYTPISHDKAEGVIYSKDYSSLYTATTVGLFGIIPWAYSLADYPTITVVFYKSKDNTTISMNESNSSFQESKLEQLRSGILDWYTKTPNPLTPEITKKESPVIHVNENPKSFR